jgi:hypothetical protein
MELTMTSAVPEPPAVPPDAEADARFAAYLADIATRVDDPVWGEDYRAVLNDDPQTQRALFDLGEAVATTPGPPPPELLLWTVAALLLLAAALVVLIVGFVA